MESERLKIVIVGHVDHGKSTLIGRLFYDTDSLPHGKVENIRKACEAEGMEFEYAFLLDALLEEQAQNITIDTTQIQFRTPKRQYIIIDAPGHKEFLKNMITGAANADTAILLIDAHEGIQEQSRRHGFLLSLLGIKQVIVAINKMDLVNFDQNVYENLREQYSEFLKNLGVTPAHFIPVSAKQGHNIIRPSEEMPWFIGPPVLEALDAFHPPPSKEKLPLRFVLQDIYRFDERRILAGRIESGTLKVGDELIFWPDRKRSRVKTIEEWGNSIPQTRRVAGYSVAITLAEQIFAERGQIASHTHEGPVEAREFKARLFWIHDEPLRAGQPYQIKLATQTVEARITSIERVMDSSTLEITDTTRLEVRKNEVAEITIRARRPMAFDNSEKISETGRFVLMQGERIGGGGIIFDAQYPSEETKGIKSENLTWTVGRVTREERAEQMTHRGAVIWLTGLSGSGKSTLAVALEWALHRRGIISYILDGDNLRHGLCSDLGFEVKDRKENIRRAGEVAKLMAEAGLVVITSLISPLARERQTVRESCHAAGIAFAEVYVNASLEICEKRDPRGLYKKARAGEIRGFTGIDSPYEAPLKPTLELRTGELSLEESLNCLTDLAIEISHPGYLLKAEEQEPVTSI